MNIQSFYVEFKNQSFRTNKRSNFFVRSQYNLQWIEILPIYLFLGREKIVQMLIERGANINAVDVDNNSALIFAASKGNIANLYI